MLKYKYFPDRRINMVSNKFDNKALYSLEETSRDKKHLGGTIDLNKELGILEEPYPSWKTGRDKKNPGHFNLDDPSQSSIVEAPKHDKIIHDEAQEYDTFDDYKQMPLSIQKYIIIDKQQSDKPLVYRPYEQLNPKMRDWVKDKKVLFPRYLSDETILYQPKVTRNIIQTFPLGRYNLGLMTNEEYFENDKYYCVIKLKFEQLRFLSPKIKTQFDEYIKDNNNILFLIYNIYWKDTEQNLMYLLRKEQTAVYSLDYIIKQSSKKEKTWSVMELFEYLRNYQLIMMNKIYLKIHNLRKIERVFDKDTLITEFLYIITVEEETFKEWLEEKAFKKWLYEEAFKKWLYEEAFKKWLIDNKIYFHTIEYESKKDEFKTYLEDNPEANPYKIDYESKKDEFKKYLEDNPHANPYKIITKYKSKKYLEDNPEANLYRIITEDEAKLKYIYSMFMDYLRTIYVPIIVRAFLDIKKYSTFNMFNTHYLRNFLLLQNKIYYQNKLKKEMFDFELVTDDVRKKYEKEIDKINLLIDEIDKFIIFLDTDENGEKTKALGSKLLESLLLSEGKKYEDIIKEFMFYFNVNIDYAVFYICPEKYDSEIIHSPATTLSKEGKVGDINDFCEVIDDIPGIAERPEPYNRKEVKIYSISAIADIDKYKRTCPSKYESSDYLMIPSPISKFMLFYWSPFVNSFLTDYSIKNNYNNVVIWDKKYDYYVVKNSRFPRPYVGQLKDLMTTHVYLGFIKINVIDGVKLIFVFIRSYYIKLYDVYGSQLIYGNYTPHSFITSQEIPKLVRKDNKSYMYKVKEATDDTDPKNNKDYYLVIKEILKYKDRKSEFQQNIE
jgi:hypothetical protein